MLKRYLCLMSCGLPLHPDSADELNVISAQMIHERKTELRIHSKGCEGEIKTKYELYCVGSFAGFLFNAILETEEGKFNIKYLVQPVEAPPETQWVFAMVDEADPANQFRPVSLMN